MLILDDAHAGEQFVGEQYGINISRNKDTAAYYSVLAALAPLLSGLLLQRLRDPIPDPGAHHQVRLLLPAIEPSAISALDKALAQLQSPHNFQLAMIRNGLRACSVYLSYGGIQIRPMIPPTFENPLFSGARQRLYLSATLGVGGELERAFGRRQITRLPLPPSAQPRSGRRLFVFPEIASGNDAEGLIRRLIGMTRKAIVLTQNTTEKALSTAEWLSPGGVPIFGKTDVEHSLEAFNRAPEGVLGLANRYDGLDLPDDACRMVVLDGLPNAASLQERFLGERADANAALAERLRTRVVQGAGRCTRGPNDYAVVVVRGADLTRYFARPEVRAALESELQAEVDFGWRNSREASHNEIVENVENFLEHDEAWREDGEPALAEFRRDAQTVSPPGSAALQGAVASEVDAWRLACQEDWLAASAQLQQAAREVGKGGEATRGYRALLLYLAGVWLNYGANTEVELGRARELIRQAEAAAERGNWLQEMTPLPNQEPIALPAADRVAAAAVAARLAKGVKADRLVAANSQMTEDLEQDEAVQYERGLASLGSLLGAEAFKPPGSGRCDSAWLWDTALWVSVEAKSEQNGDKTIPLRDIRQANTQLDQLAADRKMGHPPAGSSAIIVSSRLTVEPEHAGAANPNVYLASPEVIRDLASDARTAWATLVPAINGQDHAGAREFVADTLRQYGCLPSQAKERLTVSRIRPLS